MRDWHWQLSGFMTVIGAMRPLAARKSTTWQAGAKVAFDPLSNLDTNDFSEILLCHEALRSKVLCN